MADRQSNSSRSSDLPVAKLVRRGVSQQSSSQRPHQAAPQYSGPPPHYNSSFTAPTSALAQPAATQLATARNEISSIAGSGTATLLACVVFAVAAMIGPAMFLGAPGFFAGFFIGFPLSRWLYTKTVHAQLRGYYAATDAHLAAALTGSPAMQYQQLLKIRDLLLADPTIGPRGVERWRTNHVLHMAYMVLHATVQDSKGRLPHPQTIVETFHQVIQGVVQDGQPLLIKREELTAIFYALLQFYSRLPQGRKFPILPIGDLVSAVGPAIRQDPIYAPGPRSPDRDLGLYLDIIFNFATAYENQDVLVSYPQLLLATQHLQQAAALPSLAATMMQLHSPGMCSMMWGKLAEPLHFKMGEMAAWIHSYNAKAGK